MKKRLRKKHRLAEFREFGFDVSFSLSGQHTEAEIDQFFDGFIVDVIEARGLLCGGGGHRNWSFFVTRGDTQSASEDDREYILSSMRGYPNVVELQVGPLVDAWHSP